MNTIKKRFGTINMTREIEETVLGDAKQMELLYEEIENLKVVVNKKDLEIKILKEENEAYKLQIETFKLLYKDNTELSNHNENIEHLDIKKPVNIDIKDNKEYIKVLNELDKIKSEYNYIKEDYINIQRKNDKTEEKDEKIKSLENIIEDLKYKFSNIDNKENEFDEKQDEINKLNETIKILQKDIKKVKNKPIKNKPEVQDFNILTKYPIKVYKDIGNSKIKKLIAAEIAYKVKYQCRIAKETERNEENITMDEIIDYIIQQEELSQQDKSRLKYKFERCIYLNKNYEDKLNIFKFSIYNLSNMSKKHWDLWLNELDRLIQENYNIENNLNKKGNDKDKKCNKINCKNKNHLEIN